MNLFHLAKRSRLIVTIILALGVVSVGWIYWFLGATKYQSEIDRWISIGRDEGYEISYDRREQFGFPRHTVLRFVNLRWKNTNGIEFHAGDLDISADLWQTKNFFAKFKGQVEINVPVEELSYVLVLAGSGGTAQVSLADDGSWIGAAVTMKDARLGRAPDFIFLAKDLSVSAKRPVLPPKNMKEAGLTVSGAASDITLPAAMPKSFGPEMAHVAVGLRVMGAPPDFRNKASTETWNKNFGVVDFDRLDIDWGPLLLASKGTMGFDDDLQPEGAFVATIGHQDQVLETLKRDGYIAATQENMLSSGLRLFAKPMPIKGEDGIEVPIAVQLGGLYFGPVKIFSFPAIEWD